MRSRPQALPGRGGRNEWCSGGARDGVARLQPWSDDTAPTTSGTTATKTKDGSVHTTNGKLSRTGSSRADISAWRRRCSRASSASRPTIGASGRPVRFDTRIVSTRVRAREPSRSTNTSSASPTTCRRSIRRQVSSNASLMTGLVWSTRDRIASTGEAPDCKASTNNSSASGYARSSARWLRRAELPVMECRRPVSDRRAGPARRAPPVG